MGYTNDIREVIEKFQSRITQASSLIESGKYDEAILELEKIQREAWQYKIPQISALVENTLKDAEMIKKIVKIFKVSRKLKIDDFCEQLKSSRKEGLDLIFKWGEKLGLSIDGDFISVNSTIDKIIIDWWDNENLKEHKKIENPNNQIKMDPSKIGSESVTGNSLIVNKYKTFISFGDIAFKNKEYKYASEQYNKAINIAKNELFDSNLVFQAELSLEKNQKMQENNELIKNGENLFQNGKYEESIKLFEQAKTICEYYKWDDDIQYANEMIDNCRKMLNAPLSFNGVLLVKPEYNCMMELEKKLGVTIPALIQNGVNQSSFGFFASNNHVVRLEIYKKNLSSLPDSIGSLKLLTHLWLSNNQLTFLPEGICLLKSLEYLNLGWNQLSSLPKSFGSLQSLKRLELGWNQLLSLPESFGLLQSLKRLDLGWNKLSILPESFGSLESLERLYLQYNQLKFLPGSFSSLSSLKKLWLNNNQLPSLPENFGSLLSLTYLNLKSNQFASLPERIKNQLKILKNNGCEINGISFSNGLGFGNFPPPISPFK